MLKRKLVSLSLMAALIAGCGGGGDDAPPIRAVSTTHSAVGVWQGTLTYTAGSTGAADVRAIVAPDGEFTVAIGATGGNTGRLLKGTGSVTGANQFSGSGIGLAAGGFPTTGNPTSAAATITGTVTSGTSISATYSAGGETGTLALTYHPAANRPSSFAIAQGNYTAIDDSPREGVITIDSGGTLMWASTDCTGFGNVTILDATKNIYRWQMTVSSINGPACTLDSATPLQGLAYLATGIVTPSPDKLIVMHGARPSAGFVYLGEKP